MRLLTKSRLAATVLATFMLASPALASPPRASGTTSLEFQSYIGPVAAGPFNGDPTSWYLTGRVNTQDAVTAAIFGLNGFSFTGSQPVDFNVSNGAQWFTANVRLSGNSVDLGYRGIAQGDPYAANIISFTGAPFSGVAVGEEFKLGTISFQNGGWFGGSPDNSSFNLRSILNFRIRTTSGEGPEFNQYTSGRIILTVNNPRNNDTDTDQGKDAEADWISVYETTPLFNEDIRSFGSFRVYESGALRAGFNNVGTIDLYGKFGSLDLTGLANPQGGFYTVSNAPLPPVPLPPIGPPVNGVPEPASWALLIAGFGLTGAVMRRRRVLTA